MLARRSTERPGVALQRSDTCRRLVAEARGFSVEFEPCMANHLPMVLVALGRMGAKPARLDAYFEAYRDRSRLPPAPESAGRVHDRNWMTRLGERVYEGDYRAYFAAEVSRLGMVEAQRRHLPRLVPGIAASALHALMRLAYADLEGDADEAATALGYWATTFLPLRVAGTSEPITDDPAAILGRLRGIEELRRVPPPEPDLLWRWMRAVARTAAFPPVVDWLAPRPGLLDQIARVSLTFYAATMTFEALHALTGCHWLRLVRPHWGDEALAVRYFWQAIAAVYPKIGMPELPPPEAIDEIRALPCPDWPEIMARACASDDEHDISLVFSAAEEGRHRGDRLYRVVAARRVGLIE
jgi:hypothetical protein